MSVGKATGPSAVNADRGELPPVNARLTHGASPCVTGDIGLNEPQLDVRVKSCERATARVTVRPGFAPTDAGITAQPHRCGRLGMLIRDGSFALNTLLLPKHSTPFAVKIDLISVPVFRTARINHSSHAYTFNSGGRLDINCECEFSFQADGRQMTEAHRL